MKASFIAEMDSEELALRLMQIGIGKTPPPGTSATAALDEVEGAWPSGMITSFPFRRMAHASLEYFRECIEKGQRPS